MTAGKRISIIGVITLFILLSSLIAQADVFDDFNDAGDFDPFGDFNDGGTDDPFDDFNDGGTDDPFEDFNDGGDDDPFSDLNDGGEEDPFEDFNDAGEDTGDFDDVDEGDDPFEDFNDAGEVPDDFEDIDDVDDTDGFDEWDDDFDDGFDDFDDWDDDGFEIYWMNLDSQSILEDSPDNTTVYPALAQRCVGGNGAVSVQSSHSFFELFFSGGDLLARNLQADWTGSEIVWLDCGGISASFLLTVVNVNDAPEIIPAVQGMTFQEGDTGAYDLSRHQYDIDGDALSWSIASSVNPYFTAQINGDSELQINAVSAGSADITLVLTDSSGAFDSQIVTVNVLGEPNHAPIITPAVPDLSVRIGDTLRHGLAGHEFDMNNPSSELFWTVSSHDTTMLSARVDGKELVLNPKKTGSAKITLTLRDAEGWSDSQEVNVNIVSETGQDEEDDERIFIGRISLGNGGRMEGNTFTSFVSLENSGNVDLEDIKITMIVQDMPAYGSAGPFDLDSGDKITKRIIMMASEEPEPGIYYARFTISNGDVRRVVYRPITVE